MSDSVPRAMDELRTLVEAQMSLLNAHLQASMTDAFEEMIEMIRETVAEVQAQAAEDTPYPPTPRPGSAGAHRTRKEPR